MSLPPEALKASPSIALMSHAQIHERFPGYTGGDKDQSFYRRPHPQVDHTCECCSKTLNVPTMADGTSPNSRLTGHCSYLVDKNGIELPKDEVNINKRIRNMPNEIIEKIRKMAPEDLDLITGIDAVSQTTISPADPYTDCIIALYGKWAETCNEFSGEAGHMAPYWKTERGLITWQTDYGPAKSGRKGGNAAKGKGEE
ncbi:hypothetical protein MMC25_001552 [Agyrium rufum]|nr:hypothetical protein [Agyrium rufum]